MRSEPAAAGRGRRLAIVSLGAMLALAAAACERTPPAADAATPAPPDPAKTMNPADLEDVTASYRCDEGHRIDIVRDRVARLALADGRVVKLEGIRDSTPRTFMDNGLIFSLVSDDAAKLDDEEGHTVSCAKIETARPVSP